MTKIGARGIAWPEKPTIRSMKDSIMKRLLHIALALMALGAAGCDDGKYPVTGETCTASDPVVTLDARDCTVPSAP